MNWKIRLLTLWCSIISMLGYCAQNIDIVISKDASRYKDTIEEFKSQAKKRNLSQSIDQYTLSLDNKVNLEEDKKTFDKLSTNNDNILLTIGSSLTQKVITNLPQKKTIFIAAVGLDVPEIISNNKNTTGIFMDIGLGTQVDYLHKLLPELKTIAVIYNPLESSKLINTLQEILNTKNLTLNKFPVNSIKEINSIENFKSQAILLVPDRLVCQPLVLQHIFMQAFREKAVVMGLTSSYVKSGAVIALEADFQALGVQAADILEKILSGTKPSDIAYSYPSKVVYFLNAAIIEKLGLPVSKEFIDQAAEVFGQ